MDGRDLSNGFAGLVRLAIVGAFAIQVIVLGAIIGVPILIWWAYNHITFH